MNFMQRLEQTYSEGKKLERKDLRIFENVLKLIHQNPERLKGKRFLHRYANSYNKGEISLVEALDRFIDALNIMRLVDKPLCNYFKGYEMAVTKFKDPNILFREKKPIILKKLKENIKEYNGIKFSIGLSLKFFKDELNGARKEVTAAGHGNQSAVLNANNFFLHLFKQNKINVIRL